MSLQPPFTASDAWMQTLLSTSTAMRLPDLPVLEQDARCFDLLLSLYCHESLMDQQAFLGVLDRLQKQSSLLNLRTGFRWQPCKGSAVFLRSAKEVVGLPLSLRNGPVRVNTGNVLSAAYVPPTHVRAKSAVNVLLRMSFNYFRKCTRYEDRVRVAVLTYFILLTIHPFKDGNGRAARFYFAAHISEIRQHMSALLLTLPMLHRNRSEAFQLAAKIARLGDAEALLNEFSQSATVAVDIFSNDLALLSQQISIDGRSLSSKGISLLLSIRARVSAYVLG